jgi:hypothetical protein
MQSVAIGSQHGPALPTVHSIAARHQRNERKDRTMKSISSRMRLTSLLLAVLTSATVLGATVAGMQPGSAPSQDLVVMEHVTVKPTTVQ